MERGRGKRLSQLNIIALRGCKRAFPLTLTHFFPLCHVYCILNMLKVCHRCRVQFSTFTRQHHCRACGQVFCGKCSSKVRHIDPSGVIWGETYSGAKQEDGWTIDFERARFAMGGPNCVVLCCALCSVLLPQRSCDLAAPADWTNAGKDD